MDKRAAIYIRLNLRRKNQAQLVAVEEAMRRACVDLGAEVIGVFVDEQVSGQTLTRPQLIALRTRVAMGQVDVVVCPELKQWTTCAGHFMLLLEELETRGVRLEISGAGAEFEKLIQTGRATIATFEEYLRAERRRKVLQSEAG